MTRSICLVLLVLSTNALAQTATPIRVAFRGESPALVTVDTANWTDAWIETLGEDAYAPRLLPSDLLITSGRDTARIISIDSVGARVASRLTLSFVLDNSASMFSSYDTLTRYLDTLLHDLPIGIRAQAVTFDNFPREASHRTTERGSVYLAQTGFVDSLPLVSNFWHFYDTVRVAYTPFFDAIRLAIENVVDYSRPHVVIAITDGDDNASMTSVEDLGRLASGEHIRLFLITLSDLSLRLKWLAKVSGGSWYYAGDAGDLRNLLHELGLTMSRSYHVRYLFASPSPSSPIRHE